MKMTLEQLDNKMIEQGYSPVFLNCEEEEIKEIVKQSRIQYVSFDELHYMNISLTIFKENGLNSLVKINK